MIRRNTWILLIVLAALVGFSFYLKIKRQNDRRSHPYPGSALLFSSTDGTPNDIKMMDLSGNSVEIARIQAAPGSESTDCSSSRSRISGSGSHSGWRPTNSE